ncbi:MAG TPA: prepilin-type N-terminal cleavage/methylation domain-containing protein [Sumerlaeia bacterium]|nr:prepilin-type N-terminal cleavage/methylation domain-containing protein [Sumerlaeia bacterium]
MSRRRESEGAAFTLIELLIVVAIIAILAAIAVPNFLEAQVRSKVSRAYNDIRTLRVGLEAYRVENNGFPIDYGLDEWRTWSQITTPVAYITSAPTSPFYSLNFWHGTERTVQPYVYGGYYAEDGTTLFDYYIQASGPDLINDFGDPANYAYYYPLVAQGREAAANLLYDSTNGTRSSGDIIATHKYVFNIQ